MRSKLKLLLIIALTIIYPTQTLAVDTIVATNNVFYNLTAMLVDDNKDIELVLLNKGTTSIHSFQLKPSHIVSMNKAKVVVWGGELIEPQLKKAINQLPSRVSNVDLSKTQDLYVAKTESCGCNHHHHHHTNTKNNDKQEISDKANHVRDNLKNHKHEHNCNKCGHKHEQKHDHVHEHKHGHGHKHGHEHKHGRDEHNHNCNKCGHKHEQKHDHALTKIDGKHEEHKNMQQGSLSIDPHYWLNTDNAALMLSNISKSLIKAFPEKKEEILSNLENAKQKLKDLKKELKYKFKNRKIENFLVFHNAYKYFEEEFNLPNAGVITQDPEKSLSPKNMKEIYKLVHEEKVKCIFSEPQFSPKVILSIKARYPNLKVGTIDPLGNDNDLGPSGYITLINKMAESYLWCSHENAPKH